MEAKKIKYPVGYQDFRDIREGNIDVAMENLCSLLKGIPYGKNEPKVLQSVEDTEDVTK
jgi:hypothetical protein